MLSGFNVFKNYFLNLLVITISVLLLAAQLAWLKIHHPPIFQGMNNILAQYAHFFTLFRWVLIGLLFAIWPKLIKHVANKQNWTIEKLHFWLAQRLRMISWLIIFELVVCENLFIRFIHLI